MRSGAVARAGAPLLADPPNGRAADTMADVLQRALDPRVAPRWILRGHPHDELTDREQDTASSGFSGVRPFPGDQLAMPPQQRIRCRDRGDLLSAARPTRYARAASRRRSSSVRRSRRPSRVLSEPAAGFDAAAAITVHIDLESMKLTVWVHPASNDMRIETFRNSHRVSGAVSDGVHAKPGRVVGPQHSRVHVLRWPQ